MNTDAIFSSKSDCWATPQYLFDRLNHEFHFTLDPCADVNNYKCDKYFTRFQDGLSQSWGDEIVFCNPPYGRKVEAWVKKCYLHSKGNGIAVMLLPARVDTRWFHDYVYHNAEIRFIKGRIKFEGAKYNAPFPVMVVIFR